MNIGLKINELIEKKKFSINELCSELNISRTSFYNYINNEREIPLSTLIKLCESFNIPFSFFYEDSEIKDLKQRVAELEFVIKGLLGQIAIKSEMGDKSFTEIYESIDVKALLLQYKINTDEDFMTVWKRVNELIEQRNLSKKIK